MKFEFVDAAAIVIALGLLAAYIKIGTPAFLYAFAAVVLGEIFAIYWDKRQKNKK